MIYYTRGGFCQRDDRWGPARLGTSTSQTISRSGCLITAAAEMLKRMQTFPDIDPGQLNRWLTNNGGYKDGHYFIYESLERLPGDMVHLNQYIDCEHIAAPVDTITAIIESNTGLTMTAGVLLHIDMYPYSGGEHWVLAYDTYRMPNGQVDYKIMDPWTGEEMPLMCGRYGRADWNLARMIYRAAVYVVM